MSGAARQEMGAIAERLNASPAARHLMEAFARVIGLDIAGETPFFVRIEEGWMHIHDGVPNDPDLIVEIAAAGRFVEVLRGAVDVTHPIAEGVIILRRGRVSEMILLNRIFAAGQKRSAP